MDIITHSSGITGAVESQIGGRKENQDDYGWAETKLGLLLVVCDGMGGGPAGKTASSLARQAIIKYVSGASYESDPELILKNSVARANQALLKAIAENPELNGMGTTCVVLLISDKKAYMVHTGDSRIYQLRKGVKIFRTTDHSYVAEMVKRGSITEEEARNSNVSNVITRAIGVQKDVDPELDVVKIKDGDRFAMMTDGIWGTMPEETLISRLGNDTGDVASVVTDVTMTVDELGKQRGGGHDNLTLLMVDIRSDIGSRHTSTGKSPDKSNVKTEIPKRGEIQVLDVDPDKSVSSERRDSEQLRSASSSQSSGKFWKTFSWILMLLLAASIAFNIILYYYMSDEGGNVTGPVVSVQKYDNREVNKAKQIIADHDKIAASVQIRSNLDEAVKCLESLSIYGNDDAISYTKEMRDERIHARKELIEKVVVILENCINIEDNSERCGQLQKLHDDILNNKYIAEGIDKRKGLTTKEASEEILRYIKRIEALSRQSE